MIQLHDELKNIFDGKVTEAGTVLRSKGEQYTVRLSDGQVVKGIVQRGVSLDPGASVSVILGNPNIVVPSSATRGQHKRIYI